MATSPAVLQTDEGTRVSSSALAELLRDASMRLDDAVSQLKKAGVAVEGLGSRLELADNNSTCNTACTCGALADRVQRERG